MQFHDFYDLKALVQDTICKPKDINWRKVRSLRYTETDVNVPDSADGSSSQHLIRFESNIDTNSMMSTTLPICHRPRQNHCVPQMCHQGGLCV